MGPSAGGGEAAQGARRSPWLAALLSLILPGLGQLYVGHTRLGLAVFATFVAWPWLLFFLIRQGLLPRLWLFAALLALLLALILFALIDPALKARRAGGHGFKHYNLWHYPRALVAGWV